MWKQNFVLFCFLLNEHTFVRCFDVFNNYLDIFFIYICYVFFFLLSHSLYSLYFLHCICCFNWANIHNVLIVIHILKLNFCFSRFQKVTTLPKGSFQQWMEILLGWEHSAANEYISTITCCPLLFCSCTRTAAWQKSNEPLAESGRCEQRNCRDFSRRGIPASSVCARTALEKEQRSQQTERRKEKRGRLKKKKKRYQVSLYPQGKTLPDSKLMYFLSFDRANALVSHHICVFAISVSGHAR